MKQDISVRSYNLEDPDYSLFFNCSTIFFFILIILDKVYYADEENLHLFPNRVGSLIEFKHQRVGVNFTEDEARGCVNFDYADYTIGMGKNPNSNDICTNV